MIADIRALESSLPPNTERAASASPKMSLWIRLAVLLLALIVLNQGVTEASSQEWFTLDNVEIVANPSNDADSFNVRHQGRDYVLRLYHVDAPETNLSYPDRVRQQSLHHRKSIDEALEIGRYATQVVAQALSRPFTVITRFQHGLGQSTPPRIYAYVITSDGYDLGEVLLSEGLARSYGVVAAPPGRTTAEILERYSHLESFARQQGYGIYSPNPLDSIRAPNVPGGGAVTRAIQTSVGQEHRQMVNINNATLKELQTLPGVGPVLAQRIIDMRPYSSIEDLRRVRGIGEKTMERMRPVVSHR